MFDVGFWELALIAVVALLVVGPERLPALARTVGLWVGRLRRYVSTVKDDIEREIRADELKEMLEKSKDVGGLADVVAETESTLGAAHRELEQVEKEAEQVEQAARGLTAEPSSVDTEALGAGATESEESDTSASDPGAAATTVGEAVSASNDKAVDSSDAAAAVEETTSTDTDDDQGDERRSR
jgi:sec-independent protein translocase protein TatB